MDDVSVRARRPADLDACVAALRQTYDADAYPLIWPSDPHAWLNPARLRHAWVAEDRAGEIVGHVALQRPTDGGERDAEVSRLYVTPAARRRSVATMLLRHAVDWATARRLRLTLTVVDDHRSAAIGFYEARGWVHTATTRADWSGPGDEVVRLRHYVRPGPAVNPGRAGT